MQTDSVSGTDRQGPTCVAVINLKGGVGKTTIAALLGRHAVRKYGLDVLAVDLDPQANLSQAYMHETYRAWRRSKKPSIVELFSQIQPPGPETRSPGTLRTEDAVVRIMQGPRGGQLDLVPSRFDFSKHLRRSVKPDATVLARCIAQHFEHKDLVLIDCAPTESVFTTAAYHASRFVLVPVRPEYFATIGFPLLQRSLTAFREENQGHSIDVIGVVINNSFYHGGNDGGPEKERAMPEIREEAQKNGWRLFRHEIDHSRGYPKLMRGDYRWLGNAKYFEKEFGEEFFERLGMRSANR